MKPAQPNHPQDNPLQLSHQQLSAYQWGTGKPILCLHGLGDHGGVWRSLGESLSTHYSIVALDLPGHGNSKKPNLSKAYLSSSIVQLLEEFAVAQEWASITVIAHSWAAKLALIWAQQKPKRIQRLILIDPFFVNRFPFFLKPTLPILYRVLPFLKMMGPFSSRTAAEQTAKQMKQYQGWSPLQQHVFENSIHEKEPGIWASKFTAEARNGVFLDTFQQSGLTADLNTPTHILLPEAGLNRREWQLAPYKKHLRQLQFHQVAGNHWPHLVNPNTTNEQIQHILDSE